MLDSEIDPEFYRQEHLLFFGWCLLVVVEIWLFRKNWLKASVAGVVTLIFGMAIIPSIPRAQGLAQRAACICNLKAIDNAKTRWAAEKHKLKNDTPADSDLFGEGLFLKQKPQCPAGGTYVLGAVGKPPTCSLTNRWHILGSKD